MKHITKLVTLTFTLSATLLIFSKPTHAGIFNLTQFVDYKNWNVGIEPELTLNNGSGFATNVKFTYGINDLSNLQAGVGTGSGAREFRLGGAYTLDIIPDLDGQVGFGLGAQAYYYRVRHNLAQTNIQVFPYLHNAFQFSTQTVDPYISMPVGLALVNGNYLTTLQVATGVFFKISNHLGYNLELGINAKNSDNSLSGGVTYTN